MEGDATQSSAVAAIVGTAVGACASVNPLRSRPLKAKIASTGVNADMCNRNFRRVIWFVLSLIRTILSVTGATHLRLHHTSGTCWSTFVQYKSGRNFLTAAPVYSELMKKVSRGLQD